EVGILVGGPFIEDVDGPVLQIGRQQREAFALPLRELGRGELSALDLYLALELEPHQVVARLLVEIRGLETQQRVEQEEVREDDREQLAVLLPVRVGDGLSVEEDLSLLGRVEPDEDLS